MTTNHFIAPWIAVEYKVFCYTHERTRCSHCSKAGMKLPHHYFSDSTMGAMKYDDLQVKVHCGIFQLYDKELTRKRPMTLETKKLCGIFSHITVRKIIIQTFASSAYYERRWEREG